MAEDRRDELLRKAIETSLIWNDEKKDADIPVEKMTPSAGITTPEISPSVGTNFSPGSDDVAPVEDPTLAPSLTTAGEQVFIVANTPEVPENAPSIEKSRVVVEQPKAQAGIVSPQAATIVTPPPPTTSITYRPQGPVGIDIGTTSIVIAEGREKKIFAIKQTKFAKTFPPGSYTKSVIFEHEVPYFELSNFEYLQGYASETISNTFHGDPQWRYSNEVEQEQEGLCLIEGILQNLLGRPKIPAVPLYYSVPGESIVGGNSLLYHIGIIRTFLTGLGYSAKPVNEGLAVVMAELADNNFTGVGVSMGGSMCHICLAYLSVPVLCFSIPKAGDYIDQHVAACTGELQHKVREIKENGFSLTVKPRNHVERALRVYFDDVVQTVVNGIKSRLKSIELPISGPIPLVFSGGLMETQGLLHSFMSTLNKTKLAVEFSRIEQASDPLTSVARGALVKAMAEEF